MAVLMIQQSRFSVNPSPQAMFSASVSCVNDSTSFTDLSIAPGSSISAWYWEFGDGGTSTLQNPKHKYTSSGTFNVTETVTNLANCKDSITIPVITRPTPVAQFSYTSFFCPAGEVSFTNNSHGVGSVIVSQEWIFQPGATSSQPDPVYTFPVTDTTYLVTLIVTDSYGCMDTTSDSVHVKPGFAFTYSNDTVCYKNPTHFRAIDLTQGDSLYNVTWNFEIRCRDRIIFPISSTRHIPSHSPGFMRSNRKQQTRIIVLIVYTTR